MRTPQTVALLVGLGLLATGPGRCRAADARPNLIFLLTDDQRRDSLGCYGNPTVRTPHIDRLAADGVLFENAFVTSAICTPSRACYFLGQFERRHGVNFNSGTAMAPEAWRQGYPVLLREAGYFTGYVGKNHVPVGPRGYAGGIPERSFDVWYAAHGHLGFYPKTSHAIFRQARADTQVEVLEEGALAFLERRPADRPFCLTVAFNLPHTNGTSTMRQLPTDPELYRSAYRDRIDDLPLPANYVAKADIRTPKLPADVLYARYRQASYDYVDTPGRLRERYVREYQTITGIDRMVGALRDRLAALGLAGNTVIVFASDHGIMHGEFGLGGKALNYEPCLRIPLIVMDPRLPSGRRGRRASELVMSIDVAPTLLALADVAVPDSVQGRSLVPLLRGEPVAWRDAAFAENLWSNAFGNPRCESVRTRRWKYIRYFQNDRSLFGEAKGPGAGRVTPEQAAAYARWLSASILGEEPVYEELFDLDRDPDEATNLAADPAHATDLDRLRTEARRLVREARGDAQDAPRTVPWLGGEGEGRP